MIDKKQKDELTVDGWLVTDLPAPYVEKDYEEARAELIKQAENTPELGALFEYGYIPFLGISDMDFWVVFPNDTSKMYLAAHPRLTEKTKHVMMHQTALITEKHYKKMLYFDPWTRNVWPNGHKLLYKRSDITRDLNFENIEFSNEDKAALSVVYMEDCLLVVFATIPMYAKKELHVREVFENIKNIIYVIREINAVTHGKITSNFSEEFNQLRSEWFTISQEEGARRLIKLLEEALLIGFEATFILGEWLTKRSCHMAPEDCGVRKVNWPNGSKLDKCGTNLYLNTFKERRVYTDLVKDPKHALELSVRSCQDIKINLGLRSKETEFHVTFLPLGMSAMLSGSLSKEGLLSRHLAQDIFTNADKLPVFEAKIFKEKSKMIDDITETYNQKKVPKMNGKGWIYGNNHFGYSFDDEKLRRKLLTLWLKRIFWRSVNRIAGSLK